MHNRRVSEPQNPQSPVVPSDGGAPRWTRYVAVGDSFSEGMSDPYPGPDGTPGDDEGRQRGWADRLADTLSERRVLAGLEPLEYANLAIRGRLLQPIIEEQLPAALAMKPDLVSIIGGGNDILRPGVEIDVLSQSLEDAVASIRATGADVIMATGFKAGGGLAWTRKRTGQFNANIWSIARRQGAYVLDLWGMRSLFDLRLWAPDRLHLRPDGHRRVMNAALLGLGQPLVDPDFDVPLPAAPPVPIAEKAKADAEWARTYVAPWIKRRVTHQSSGDGRSPKWAVPVRWPDA